MVGKPRRNDGALVDLLAAGRSNADAARLSGISVRTVNRRMADSDFRQRLDVRRAEMFERGAARMADLVSRSIDTLSELMEQSKSESIRLSAAKSVIDGAVRLRELISIESRLAEMERQFGGQQ